MPCVQSLQITSTSITVVSGGTTKTLTYASIPATNNTVAKVETYANTWLAANVPECQAVVHVFVLSPLSLTVSCWNIGAAIPASWWL